MPERKLVVEIVGDSRSLEKTFAKSSKAATQFGNQSSASLGKSQKAFAGFGKAATAGLAFGGAAAAGAVIGKTLKDSIDAASNLNEQISKSRAVFGGSSAEIEKWATTTGDSIGIANDQALEATGTFGNLFRTVGLARAPSAEMSQALVQLAADLASFNNADPSEVLEAIRSGLIGEAEPMRRYGVLLSETRVQQQAMADTGKKNVKELTNQEKALARYEIILKDTKQAQGDFARTSGGLANQQRILRANLRDTEANIGKALVPGLIILTGALDDAAFSAGALAEEMNKLGGVDVPGVGKLGEVAKGFIIGVTPAIALLRGLRLGIEALQGEEIKVNVRGEEEIVAALNTVDAIRNSVAGGIPVIFNVEVHGLAAATSEIESLRSTTTTTLGDVWKAPAGKSPTDMTKQRNEWFDAAIGRKQDRAENIDNLRAQNAALATIATEIQARLDKTKDITRRLRLEDDLFAVERTIAQNRKQIAADTLAASKEAHQKMLEALKKQKETRERIAREQFEARRSRQFRRLGLTAEGDDPVAGLGVLRKRVASLRERIKGTPLDTAKTRGELQRIARVLSGAFGKVGRDVRAAIERMLDDIAGGLKGKDKSKRSLTGGRGFNVDKLLEGLGLSPEQTRLLRARLAGIGKTTTAGAGGGKQPGIGGPGRPFGGGTGPVATSGGIIITGPVTVVSNDPDQFQRQLQRKARRKGTQTTGPHAGNAMGTTR